MIIYNIKKTHSGDCPWRGDIIRLIFRRKTVSAVIYVWIAPIGPWLDPVKRLYHTAAVL